MNLKIEQSTLIADCERRSTDRDDLLREIQDLRAELDGLRVGYRETSNEDQGWRQHDQTNLMELDGQGKLNRRLWLVEQAHKNLELSLKDAKMRHVEELQTEISTAAGLRDRIGKLEEKVRRGRQETEEARASERSLKVEANSLRVHFALESERLRAEWLDMSEALGMEKKEVLRLNDEVSGLTEEKQAALEESKKPQVVRTR